LRRAQLENEVIARRRNIFVTFIFSLVCQIFGSKGIPRRQKEPILLLII
jgi:hypothetical protein